MDWPEWRNRSLAALLMFCLAGPCLVAQVISDPAYQAERQKASELFEQGKRLEALPLLEELVKNNPKDDQMLVALAACLVEHAATVTDQAAAGKERLRARDLLDQAWRLGNHSTLAMNLSDLLKKLPESGAVSFSNNPEVEKVMEAGENAFSRRDFDEAVKDYSKALELDPKNYSAVLFIGNSYDKQNQFTKGAEWYERAIQLDPDIETGYRYYADMLAREGDMAKARTMLIRAAVAEPYNQLVWRELHAWASINHTQINEVFVTVPAPIQYQRSDYREAPETSTVWQAYRTVIASWQKGDEFKKHFPGEKNYRHSLPEEADALRAAAKVAKSVASDPKTAALISDNPSLSLLLKLYDAGLIEPYVLFSLGDSGIAKDYATYRAKNRNKEEEYLGKFVVPGSGEPSVSSGTQPK
jgi:tetratricopeptide (TPR) repeat protein